MDGKVEMFDESRKINKSIEMKDNFNKNEKIEKKKNMDYLISGLDKKRRKKSELLYENDLIKMI